MATLSSGLGAALMTNTNPLDGNIDETPYWAADDDTAERGLNEKKEEDEAEGTSSGARS